MRPLLKTSEYNMTDTKSRVTIIISQAGISFCGQQSAVTITTNTIHLKNTSQSIMQFPTYRQIETRLDDLDLFWGEDDSGVKYVLPWQDEWQKFFSEKMKYRPAKSLYLFFWVPPRSKVVKKHMTINESGHLVTTRVTEEDEKRVLPPRAFANVYLNFFNYNTKQKYKAVIVETGAPKNRKNCGYVLLNELETLGS
jgi:hypothetical protein